MPTIFEFLYLRSDAVHVITAEHHRAEPEVNVPATIEILAVDNEDPPKWAEYQHEAICEVGFAFLDDLHRQRMWEQDDAIEYARTDREWDRIDAARDHQ